MCGINVSAKATINNVKCIQEIIPLRILYVEFKLIHECMIILDPMVYIYQYFKDFLNALQTEIKISNRSIDECFSNMNRR